MKPARKTLSPRSSYEKIMHYSSHQHTADKMYKKNIECFTNRAVQRINIQ